MCKEMAILVNLVIKNGIEYRLSSLFDGYKLEIFLYGKRIDDAVWHRFSHGFSEGLLESYVYGDCIGFETAKEIFTGWQKMIEAEKS